jgi:hypothetical protein
MAVLQWARPIFPVILIALAAVYAWTAYQTDDRK